MPLPAERFSGRTFKRKELADRQHRREGATPKPILVYPLVRDAQQRLRES